MFKISHWSVRNRALLLGLLPALIMLISLISLFVWQRIDDAKVEISTVGQVLSSQLAASIEYPVISGNFSLLAPLVENAIKAPAVVRVAITTPDGKVIYQRAMKEYESLDPEDIALYRSTVSQEQEVFSEFAEFDDINSANFVRTDIANVSIELSYVLGRDRALIIVGKAIVWASFILALCFLLAHRMANSIARPIEKVSLALSRIARGQYDSQIEVTARAEIGELQVGVNAMAVALQKFDEAHIASIEEIEVAHLKAVSANRAKSEFLAIVSHELRTPINGAMGAIQLIEQQKNSSIEPLVDIADRSLNNLLELVEDMLTLGSLEKREQALNLDPTSIPELLQHTLQELEEKSRLNNNELTIYMDGSVNDELVEIDGIKFRQLVRHLLGNAVKFTQDGCIYCSIYIENTPSGRNLRLDISDDGIGFPEEHKEAMFESFQQYDTSLTRKFDGLGIGLSICQDIIRLMGGRLSVMDNKPTGTSINCSMPIQLAVLKEGSLVAKNLLNDKFENKKILIVEDNKVNSMVADKLLRNMKLLPTCVSSGEECIKIMAKETFELVFMDCQMPGMDGFETTQAIRKLEEEFKYKSIPIVALTANTSAEIRQQCLRTGMSDYMAKPIKMGVLYDMLARWV